MVEISSILQKLKFFENIEIARSYNVFAKPW